MALFVQSSRSCEVYDRNKRGVSSGHVISLVT